MPGGGCRKVTAPPVTPTVHLRLHGLGPGLADVAKHALGGIEVGVGQQDAELVTAETSDEVGRTQTAREGLGEYREQLIAFPVPERVVDLLEVVEVEVAEGDGEPRAPHGADRERRSILERTPVGDSGQGVGS